MFSELCLTLQFTRDGLFLQKISALCSDFSPLLRFGILLALLLWVKGEVLCDLSLMSDWNPDFWSLCVAHCVAH